MYNQSVSSSTINAFTQNYSLGLQTLVTTYDVDTNTLTQLSYNGVNQTYTSITYNNVVNTLVWLLRAGTSATTYSGANNPLHEFRLYDRAFTLTEMQTLQAELNNKYTP